MDAFRGEVIQPTAEIQTDEQIDQFVRESVDSAYHPCGTCKMGIDALAVVDAELRVHGLANIRVIDASVFPTIPNGNLNAPTMMLAERGADLIKGQVIEPLETAPVYSDDHWRTRQRETVK
ncbi:MAG: Oxygen-dependent choline dehydrogenase [SAR92 bacterium MED-G29]|nr:MAG: Oxygen-dependent choline dehydrogenase [SAR92 bacterium MED-G29]